MKTCAKCNAQKEQKDFYSFNRKGGGHDYWCKVCIRSYSREYKQNLRETIIKAYGGKCACCKESQREFLSVDHVEGGGNRERKLLGRYGLYRKIISSNFPKEYRLLCHNCNLSRGFYGYCPHEREE